MEDSEFQIIKIHSGNGNWDNKAKSLTVQMEDGKTFDATFKGNMEDAQKFLQEKDKWIGKIVTINFFSKTGLGCPQYAQFDYLNCLKS